MINCIVIKSATKIIGEQEKNKLKLKKVILEEFIDVCNSVINTVVKIERYHYSYDRDSNTELSRTILQEYEYLKNTIDYLEYHSNKLVEITEPSDYIEYSVKLFIVITQSRIYGDLENIPNIHRDKDRPIISTKITENTNSLLNKFSNILAEIKTNYDFTDLNKKNPTNRS